SGRPGHLIRVAVEPADLLLDPLLPNRPLRRSPSAPGVEPGPGHLEQPGHPGDRVVALLRQHQCERFSFVSETSWAKKSDAFFKNARSIFSSEFSFRSRASSARSVSLKAPSPACCRAR